jgi:rsbT co-antagonist protein RsbR
MSDKRLAEQHLLKVGEFDIESRKRFVDLRPEDLVRIAVLKDLVTPHVDEHAAAFFDHLSHLEEAAPLFQRRALLDQARQLKREHIIAMVSGDYGKTYIEQRLQLASLYSRVPLDSRVVLGGFNALVTSLGAAVSRHFERDAEDGFRHFASLTKIAFLDIGIIVDTLIAERERTIVAQQDAIRELSTPVLQLRDRLLVLPIIGLLDSDRARQLTDGLLRAIRANRARVVVMDVTGVGAIDSKVANHLLQTVAASRLMGATVIITGLSGEVAQALVTLGVDLGNVNTMADLQGGLEEAERLLGYKVTAAGAAPKPPPAE